MKNTEWKWESVMALIVCPECGKEMSDKSGVCIHCGYPLINTKCNQAIWNGIRRTKSGR